MTCCGAHKEHNYHAFTPNYRDKPLTEKFYARHESLDMDGALTKSKNINYFKEEIVKRLKYDPRAEWLAPITDNQNYGWIEHWSTRYTDAYDRDIMYYPKKVDEMMIVLKKISYDMKRSRKFDALTR